MNILLIPPLLGLIGMIAAYIVYTLVMKYPDGEDKVKKIDKNFLGIPKEQYGFSNNVMGRMSPPTFDQAKFAIAGPTTQNIKLRIGIPEQN